jgi:hypothetical protein
MKITQLIFKNNDLVVFGSDEIQDPDSADLIIGFGSKPLMLDDLLYVKLSDRYPLAEVVLCSTAGEIIGNQVLENSVVITVVAFEKTKVQTAIYHLDSQADSYAAGEMLINQLKGENLAGVFMLADGLIVNGSQLVKGIESGNQMGVSITGGLAGDATHFKTTMVGLNAAPSRGNVVAIGFYGQHLDLRYAAEGGWDVFGPQRTVTKSNGTKVYEIDGKNALELYNIYLGPYTADRTGSSMLFPLSVHLPGQALPLVRSIASVNAKENCLVLTGDIPEGSLIQFMKASFDKLIEAAADAAGKLRTGNERHIPRLALLVSCIGRKNILEHRIVEEVEMVADHFGGDTALMGFYSYGEISPQVVGGPCELHNQTMTITSLQEL